MINIIYQLPIIAEGQAQLLKMRGRGRQSCSARFDHPLLPMKSGNGGMDIA